MNECDFSYRGETLSSHGYMLCEFDSSSSASNADTDSQKDITSISMYNGKYHPIICCTYDSALTMEMDICKETDGDDYIIEPQETAEIKRWLGSSSPNVFRILDSLYDGVNWVGVFNVEEVHYAFGCIGFHLTFTANAPFGYKDPVVNSGTVAANGSITISDISDEEGYIYPDMVIKLQSAGDLRITNAFDNRTTVVKNCSSGETLTFSHLLQITSDQSSHELSDDFNYKFLRISNVYNNIANKITFNLPCTYSITYNPIAKVVIS